MELTLKGKKVVMFDMDGVLYDSMPTTRKPGMRLWSITI